MRIYWNGVEGSMWVGGVRLALSALPKIKGLPNQIVEIDYAHSEGSYRLRERPSDPMRDMTPEEIGSAAVYLSSLECGVRALAFGRATVVEVKA